MYCLVSDGFFLHIHCQHWNLWIMHFMFTCSVASLFHFIIQVYTYKSLCLSRCGITAVCRWKTVTISVGECVSGFDTRGTWVETYHLLLNVILCLNYISYMSGLWFSGESQDFAPLLPRHTISSLRETKSLNFLVISLKTNVYDMAKVNWLVHIWSKWQSMTTYAIITKQ